MCYEPDINNPGSIAFLVIVLIGIRLLVGGLMLLYWKYYLQLLACYNYGNALEKRKVFD